MYKPAVVIVEAIWRPVQPSWQPIHLLNFVIVLLVKPIQWTIHQQLIHHMSCVFIDYIAPLEW